MEYKKKKGNKYIFAEIVETCEKEYSLDDLKRMKEKYEERKERGEKLISESEIVLKEINKIKALNGEHTQKDN